MKIKDHLLGYSHPRSVNPVNLQRLEMENLYKIWYSTRDFGNIFWIARGCSSPN